MNSLISIIIILNICSFIIGSVSNEDLTRAVACMHILDYKYQGRIPDQQTYSSMLLKCFITITELEAKEIIININRGVMEVTDKDGQRLTDPRTLREYKREELSNYSKTLDVTLKEFRKLKGQAEKMGLNTRDSRSDDMDYMDESRPSRGNSLGYFMRKITKYLKTINMAGRVILIGLVLYFVLIILAKIFKPDKIKKKEKNKNKNKNKKKKSE